eukprot:m.147183 g.147183  ORF g.147183 m.147183 type:complete len:272 (+) comp14175_c0_seq2:12-827(+)
MLRGAMAVAVAAIVGSAGTDAQCSVTDPLSNAVYDLSSLTTSPYYSVKVPQLNQSDPPETVFFNVCGPIVLGDNPTTNDGTCPSGTTVACLTRAAIAIGEFGQTNDTSLVWNNSTFPPNVTLPAGPLYTAFGDRDELTSTQVWIVCDINATSPPSPEFIELEYDGLCAVRVVMRTNLVCPVAPGRGSHAPTTSPPPTPSAAGSKPLVSPRTINIILGVALGVVLIAFAAREVTRPRGGKSKGPLMPFLALTSTSDEVGDNYEDDDQLLVST